MLAQYPSFIPAILEKKKKQNNKNNSNLSTGILRTSKHAENGRDISRDDKKVRKKISPEMGWKSTCSSNSRIFFQTVALFTPSTVSQVGEVARFIAEDQLKAIKGNFCGTTLVLCLWPGQHRKQLLKATTPQSFDASELNNSQSICVVVCKVIFASPS